MRMTFDNGLFVVKCRKEEKFRARSAGFTYDKRGDVFLTKDSFIAGKLIDAANPRARKELETRKKELAASSATDSKMKFPKPKGLEYMPFQKAGIAYAARRKSCLIADEMGCIDGEAILRLNRARKGFRVKMAEAYRRFHCISRENWNWDKGTKTRSRSLCGDEIRLNQIKTILYKGKKEVVEIRLKSGKKLRLTPDHEVAVPGNEFRMASKLKIGDTVMTNGKLVRRRRCLTKKCNREKVITYKYAKFIGYCHRCMYEKLRRNAKLKTGKFIDGDGYVRVSGIFDHPRTKKKKNTDFYEHIIVMERHLGRRIDYPREVVHHKNGNKSDNRISNLEVMSVSEHHKEHRRHLNIKTRFEPVEDTVVGIAEVKGKIDVYDIVMEGEYRNFVANGIIVHNCGKTIQAIGLINLKNLISILIVCPKSVKINWQRELEKWLVTKRKIVIIDYGKPDLFFYDIVIINYDQLVKWQHRLQEKKWDLIIADESAKLKNSRAKWSKAMAKIINRGERKLFLTGTPILNRPIELLNQLVLLGSEIGGNWFKFVTRYCRAYKDRFGWQVKGASNLEELQTRLRTEVMIRRLKVDVLPDLPPKVRQIIELTGQYDVQVNNEQEARKSYLTNKREVKKDMRRWKGANEVKYKDAVKRLQGIEQVAITEMSTLRHETAKAKLPEALIHIAEAMENEDKILVFAHHRDIIEAINKKYKKESVVIYGGTSQNNRQKAIDAFQTDEKTRLFIGSITAAGMGITLTKANTVIFAELDWTPANITQAEDRSHRIGQKKMVLVQHIVVPGSIDAKMAKMLIRKQEVIDRATNKDRLETPDYGAQMEEAMWEGR